MSTGNDYEIKDVGVFRPNDPLRKAGGWRCGLPHRQRQDHRRCEDRRHPHRIPPPLPEPLPGFKEIHPSSSAASTRSSTDDFESLKPPSASCRSTTPPSPSWRKAPPRSASASAAASSACCTWRSSRSACAGSSTWTSSPPTRPSSTRCVKTDGTEVLVDNPTFLPPSNHRRDPRAHGQGLHHDPERVHRRHHAARHGQARQCRTTPRPSTTAASCCTPCR
jgi:GTP-binding protein LepA